MKIIPIISLLVMIAGGLSAQVTQRSDLRRFMNPPEDSADAENTRIWLGIERRNNCRVIVDILDRKNQPVRHLVNLLLPAGYYNLYWDKLDDSGRYVPEGGYFFSINDCGKRTQGRLRITYRAGESKCRIVGEYAERPGSVAVDITGDSATAASIVVQDIGGRSIDTIAADTVLARGRHEIRWQPDESVVAGRYQLTILIDGFAHKGYIHRP